MRIGDILRQRRLERGETLQEVAHRAEVDPGNLSRVEKGRQQPSLKMLVQVAGALELPLSQLFARAEGVPEEVRESATEYERHLGPLHRQFHRLTPSNRELLLDIARLLHRRQGSG